MNTQTVSLSFAPSLIEASGDVPTQFAGIAYSGGVIPNYGWFGDAAIDLSSLKAPTKPVFALVNHDTDQRAGQCSITNTGTSIEVVGTFSTKTPHGQQVAAEFSEGAPWEFSVGLQGEVEVFDKPRTMEVNGQLMTINTLFRHASIREVSFVPAGADPNTKAVAFEQQSLFQPLEHPMSDDLKDKLDSVNQLNADLQVKLAAMQTDHAQVIADLNSKLANESKLHLEAVARANELAAELSQFKQTVRLNAVKQLFEDLKRDFTEESVKPYCEMSDACFAVVSADLRSLRPQANPALFKEFAVSGKTETPSELELSRKLFNEVAGIK